MKFLFAFILFVGVSQSCFCQPNPGTLQSSVIRVTSANLCHYRWLYFDTNGQNPPNVTIDPNETKDYRIWLSGSPTRRERLIAFRYLYVNGQAIEGFVFPPSGTIQQNQLPAEAYTGIEPIDITSFGRIDGKWFIQIMCEPNDKYYAATQIYLYFEHR